MIDLQMSSSTSVYMGYYDGVSHSTQNIASITSVIFSHTDEMVSSWGVYLGLATNNFAEYSVVIELLFKALDLAFII
jgi:ribonuclease HI